MGAFIWYELIADDVDAAAAFYGDVMGWRVADGGVPGMDYRIFHAPDGDAVGGLLARPPVMADGGRWFGYVRVDDADAAVARVVDGGGACLMPATTIPQAGRIALLTDPHGTPFYVMDPVADDSTAFQNSTDARPGHMVWNELTAPDDDAAITFYAQQFGWRQVGAMPMGELGDYRFIHDGPTCIGAVMGPVPGTVPGWQFYTLVPDIDAALARIVAAGGQPLQGPDEIPGGSFSLVAQDPWGVRFGLVGDRRP